MLFWAVVAFVVVDIVVMAFVLRTIAARRGGLWTAVGVDLRQVMALSNEMEQETEEFLRANWSGDPASLAPALGVLLDRFEAKARERQIVLSREQLKPMLGRLVLARRLAKGADMNAALKQVA